MSIDKLVVTAAGLLGIIFIYWFFLIKKESVVEVRDQVDVIVEGGFVPELISIPLGKKTRINFFRKDPSSCLEEIVLPDFKIRKLLPLNKKVFIEVTPKKSGEFSFSCGMNMFHGKVIVK